MSKIHYNWTELKKEFSFSQYATAKEFLLSKGFKYSSYSRLKTADWTKDHQNSTEKEQIMPQIANELKPVKGMAAVKRKVALMMLDNIITAIEEDRAGLFAPNPKSKGDCESPCGLPDINHDNARKLATTLKVVFSLVDEPKLTEVNTLQTQNQPYITVIYGKQNNCIPNAVCFNPVFAEGNTTKQRYRVFKGGAGSGKSFNVAQDFILKLMNPAYAGANLLVVRKADATNRNSTFAELTSAINRIEASEQWTIKQNPITLECQATGTSIIFRGVHCSNGIEKLKSINFSKGKLTWVWIEEATELNATDLEIIDDRLRGDLENPNLFYQITLTFNPVSSAHWLKGKFFDKPCPDTFAHHSSYIDNLYIDDGYRQRMERRKEQDPEGYRIYALGEWGEAGGLILSHWEVGEPSLDIAKYDHVVLAQDFGYNHANAILLVGFKDGATYVLKELYTFEKTAREIMSLAESMFPKHVVMWCDSAEPDKIREWQTNGWAAYPVKKGNGSVLAQIDYLKQNPLVINASCVNTLKEISQWKWIKDPKTDLYTDRPVPFMDDAMAALRYSIEDIRRYGNVNE